jgi:DNA-binding NtrC family response regulator
MLTKEKMLLVDDDEGIRKALALFFGSRNCHLRTFENASQALNAIEKEQYDIIICEQFLPDMNGLKFFEILNNRCCKAIKILITLYGNNSTINQIHTKGIDDLLTKPFSGEEVEAAMIRLINSRPCPNGSNNIKK